MRFVFLQDAHIRGKNSYYRTGNYYQDIMNKIKEIIKIAKKNKVERIIDGGDFYDVPNVSNLMIDEFVDMVEASKIPWDMLYGNHTMIGHSVENSKSTSLAHIFRRSKLVNHLEEIKGKEYYIKGYDYYHNIENDIKENGLITDSESKFKIGIVHAFVTPKPFLPQVQHVVVKEIKCNYDIVLNAHYHQPWGIKEIGGTKFVNFGCIGRLSKNEMNIKPTVLLIDTDTKEIKTVVLQNVKLSKEVFDLEKIKQDDKKSGGLKDFVECIENTKIQGLELKGQVIQVCKENNVEREVEDTTIDRIGKFENKEVI